MTSELLYKTTMIPGKNETEVLQAIAVALINDPEQKDFVQQNGIEKLLENIPTAQIELKELVEKLGDPDLITISKNLAAASPKQLTRLDNKLKTQEENQQPTVTQVPTAEARLNFKQSFPQYMHLPDEELNQKIVEYVQLLQSN